MSSPSHHITHEQIVFMMLVVHTSPWQQWIDVAFKKRGSYRGWGRPWIPLPPKNIYCQTVNVTLHSKHTYSNGFRAVGISNPPPTTPCTHTHTHCHLSFSPSSKPWPLASGVTHSTQNYVTTYDWQGQTAWLKSGYDQVQGLNSIWTMHSTTLCTPVIGAEWVLQVIVPHQVSHLG